MVFDSLGIWPGISPEEEEEETERDAKTKTSKRRRGIEEGRGEGGREGGRKKLSADVFLLLLPRMFFCHPPFLWRWSPFPLSFPLLLPAANSRRKPDAEKLGGGTVKNQLWWRQRQFTQCKIKLSRRIVKCNSTVFYRRDVVKGWQFL